jgi:hypothetical protein
MFLCNPNEENTSRVALIGEFVDIKDNHVVLKSEGNYFKIQTKRLDNFKSKVILVVGDLENGVIKEEYTQKVDDDFNFDVFQRLAKVSIKYTNVF